MNTHGSVMFLDSVGSSGFRGSAEANLTSSKTITVSEESPNEDDCTIIEFKSVVPGDIGSLNTSQRGSLVNPRGDNSEPGMKQSANVNIEDLTLKLLSSPENLDFALRHQVDKILGLQEKVTQLLSLKSELQVKEMLSANPTLSSMLRLDTEGSPDINLAPLDDLKVTPCQEGLPAADEESVASPAVNQDYPISQKLVSCENSLTLISHQSDFQISQPTQPSQQPSIQIPQPAQQPAIQSPQPAQQPAIQIPKPAQQPAIQITQPAQQPTIQITQPAQQPTMSILSNENFDNSSANVISPLVGQIPTTLDNHSVTFMSSAMCPFYQPRDKRPKPSRTRVRPKPRYIQLPPTFKYPDPIDIKPTRGQKPKLEPRKERSAHSVPTRAPPSGHHLHHHQLTSLSNLPSHPTAPPPFIPPRGLHLAVAPLQGPHLTARRPHLGPRGHMVDAAHEALCQRAQTGESLLEIVVGEDNETSGPTVPWPVRGKGQYIRTPFMHWRKAIELSRARRCRTKIEPDMLDLLEMKYNESHFVSPYERKNLAEKLGITERAVIYWFQNRRRKDIKNLNNMEQPSIQNKELGDVS